MSRKSLGTLTLDLVARTGGFVQGMDKAERSSAKWRKQVERDAQAIGSAIGKTAAAVIAATTATTVALTKKGMDAVRTQADLARSLDTTFDSITALQLAAGDVGLDGLEGSLTRLNRRLGAAEVGSGAAANAVKALQLDLKALSEMDVDERVATIADAIRDSGVSMQRAARFAQDLGFEQQQAAEFFTQGGDAIRAYRERVEALGLSLSDIDAQKVVDAQNAMGIFGDLTRGASQILAVQFSPIIQQVATDLENAAIEAGGLKDNIGEMVDTAVQGAAFVASSVDAAGRVFATLGKTAAIIFLEMRLKSYELGDSFYNGPIEAVNELIELLNIVPGIDITPRALSGIGQQIKDEIAIIEGAIREGQRDVQDGLLAPLAGERLLKYFEDAKAAAEEAAAAAVELSRQPLGDDGLIVDPEELKRREAAAKAAAAAEKARLEGIAKEITALERAAATWGMTADEVKLYSLEVQGATEAQLGRARAALEDVAAMEKAKEQQEAYLQLVKDLRTDEEKLTDQLHERLAVLDAIAAAGGIGSDEYQETARRIVDGGFADAPDFGGLAPEVAGPWGELNKVDQAEEELQEWYDKQLAMLEQFRSERADLNAQWDEQEAALHQQHQDRLADIERARQMAQMAAGEEFFGNMASAAKTFFGENSKLYQAAFAVEKAYAIGKALINVPKSYSDAYAAVVGIPIVGPALAPAAAVAAAAAQVAQAAAIGNINMTGMAHDGIDSIPKTGTWLLEKGERVTTAETSAKLDATLARVNQNMDNGPREIRLINNGPPMRMRQELDGEQVSYILDLAEERVARSMMTDGKIARTMRAGFGVSRTGK